MKLVGVGIWLHRGGDFAVLSGRWKLARTLPGDAGSKQLLRVVPLTDTDWSQEGFCLPLLKADVVLFTRRILRRRIQTTLHVEPKDSTQNRHRTS